MADPRQLARGLRAIAQRPTGAVGMPAALTPEEAAGGMMEPAKSPDVSRLVQGLRAVSQSMGGPVLDRMQARGERQQARLATGERAPSPVTGEDVDIADAVAGGMMGSIKAFHGSPHRFDRFSMDKIGTGEGAQAYGHGLYFAEEPAVARGYQSALTRTSGTAANEWALANPDLADEARRALDDFSRSKNMQPPDDNLFALMLSSAKEGNAPDAFNSDLANRIKASWEAPKGALYTTKLNVEPEDLLDWDLPLSQQSEKVRAAVEPLIERLKAGGGLFTKRLGPQSTGREIYEAIGTPGAARTLGTSGRWDSKATSTEELHKLGIPGIRYLDQGSRASGEGTRNFVIFDDSLVDITHVDGKPLTKAERKAAVAAMMAGGMGAMGVANMTGDGDGGS